MDNRAKQIEELNSLKAIYGDDWQIEDAKNRAYSIVITANDLYVKLDVKIPQNYPSKAPPKYELSAPNLSKTVKFFLCQTLDAEYLSNNGQPVLFQWIEKLREELLKQNEKQGDKRKMSKSSKFQDAKKSKECPQILHGPMVVDRKSKFQAHVAVIHSVDEISMVLAKLKEDRKIANAKHNVVAWRISSERGLDIDHCFADNDDDGEFQAGGRLLQYVETLYVKDILVVVSRWYGGIQLGYDRFRHYFSAARLALEAFNLLPQKVSSRS